MKIGILGTGNMGRALGLRWARARHEVLFGSRDLNKAGAIAANGSASTQAGDFDAAAAWDAEWHGAESDVFDVRLRGRG